MNKAPAISLVDSLRSATWHRHKEFEQLPFVIAMTDGTLPLESYIGQLRGLAVIFAAVEESVALSGSSLIQRCWQLMKIRTEMLHADLAFFSSRTLPDIRPAVQLSLSAAQTIRRLFRDSHHKLLGYLYVLEGTTKGNQVHLPDIKRCFGLEGDAGVSYYRGYGDSTESHWDEFRTTMNTAGKAVIPNALEGVIELYDALELFHKALCPFSKDDLIVTATALNPEAGTHPVPQNPILLQAALRAGRRCRDSYSYFERRYGERGRRYTDSDAAWLAALADQPESVVYDQVLWLGRVLSARGMPLLLMERQLELLVEELELLNNEIQTGVFQAVIEKMRQQRHRLLTQKNFETTCNMVSSCVSSPQAIDFADLPVILVAAHLDRLSGMPECEASLTTWLKENDMLTEEELAAVTLLLGEHINLSRTNRNQT